MSVIIPTYNRFPYLKSAIDSVYCQTFEVWELIVVDDGSTDSTLYIPNLYPEVIFLRLEENRGVSYARNQGIERARGELVCFLDSDDTWLPEKLEEQIAWMEANPESVACYTDEIWVRKGVRVNPMKKHRKYSGRIFQNCLPLCIISPSSVMLKREVIYDIGLFDESLPACEDYDLWLRLAFRYPVHFIENKLIIKMGGHSDQLSRKYWGMDRFRIRAMEKILLEPEISSEQRRWVLEALIEKCRVLGLGYKNNGKPGEAGYYSGKAESYHDELKEVTGTAG